MGLKSFSADQSEGRVGRVAVIWRVAIVSGRGCGRVKVVIEALQEIICRFELLDVVCA
jgi:hypothetical protein